MGTSFQKAVIRFLIVKMLWTLKKYIFGSITKCLMRMNTLIKKWYKLSYKLHLKIQNLSY